MAKQPKAAKSEASLGKGQYFFVLFCCSAMAAASMGVCIYSSGVFFDAVSIGLDVSLGAVSSTTTWTMLSMALMTIALPWLFKVLRYKWIITLATASTLIGILGMSFSFHIVWLDIFSILKGLGAACFGLVPVTYIIDNWFNARKGLYTGIAVSASAIGAAIMVWVLGMSVQGLGWRMGYVIQAILVGILLLPTFLLPFTLRPENLGLKPYGQPGPSPKRVNQRRGMRNFLFLVCMAFFSSIVMAIPQYFGNYAETISRSAIVGISLLSYAMIGNFFFKILGGVLSQKLGTIYTSLILVVINLIAILGMSLAGAIVSETMLAFMAFLFGSCYALAELCLPLLVEEFFPKVQYIRIYSIVSAISLAVCAISVSFFGYGLDSYDRFGWIWLLAAAFLILTMAMLWLMSGHDFKMPSSKKVEYKPELEINPTGLNSASKNKAPRHAASSTASTAKQGSSESNSNGAGQPVAEAIKITEEETKNGDLEKIRIEEQPIEEGEQKQPSGSSAPQSASSNSNGH